ncbi:uncharacterized protein [Lolium perenne]|uniref:uncharacterized protein n=1 Tax=Lolium perenne TaxID=4522 RepID=UPI0021EA2294|nr:uncharacterized protein LOC127313724 [Lolium perenne]
MVKKREPSTPAAAAPETPWKGRLRWQHESPLSSLSPWTRSRSRIRDEDARRFKKQATRCSSCDEDDGSARRPRRARARRSPRFQAGRDPEHPIVLDDADEEHEVGGNQSVITPKGRSARLHRGDKSSSKSSVEKESRHKQTPRTPNPRGVSRSKKTQNAVKKDKKQENPTSSQRSAAVKTSTRTKKHKELQILHQDSQDVPARRKTSYKKSGMQDPEPSCCEGSTRKRKRGSGRKLTSRKQSQQEPKSDCKEITPITEPRNIIHKNSGNGPSPTVQPNIGDDTVANAEECTEELSGIKGGVPCASDDWTEEQELTLRQAYFTARPSPHFWKKVSKMVPGKSAEECFNRVHADLSTPTPMAPRARTSKTQFSPLGHFTLSDPKFPKLLEPLVARRTAKQKSLAAQKTVRHLLKKHSLIDQAQEADHFSIFETSPSALQLNIPLEDSPGTPDNYLNSFPLNKYSVSSSARKRPLSRLKTKQAEPSPEVLKPLKNVVLHEKYINQLSRREGAKKPRKKAAGTIATDPENERPLLEQQAGVVKAAKNALMTEATDFICQFKKLQANSLAHILENCEDDVDNCT